MKFLVRFLHFRFFCLSLLLTLSTKFDSFFSAFFSFSFTIRFSHILSPQSRHRLASIFSLPFFPFTMLAFLKILIFFCFYPKTSFSCFFYNFLAATDQSDFFLFYYNIIDYNAFCWLSLFGFCIHLWSILLYTTKN